MLTGAAASAAMSASSSKCLPGCQTNAWRVDPRNFDSFVEALRAIKQLGFAGFETGFRNLQPHFEKLEPVKRAIEASGLRFIGVHIFLNEYDQSTMIAPQELIERVAEAGSKLGAQYLILSGGMTPNKAGMERKARALSQAGGIARGLGMMVGYHNHPPEFANGAKEIESLLKETEAKSVNLLMDAGHAFAAGADVAAFFNKHHKRVLGMHLRDFRKGDQVPLGEGEFSLGPLKAAIDKKDWSGWLICEEERLNGDKPGGAAAGPARKQLNKVFGI